jgi:hypothetical protein
MIWFYKTVKFDFCLVFWLLAVGCWRWEFGVWSLAFGQRHAFGSIVVTPAAIDAGPCKGLLASSEIENLHPKAFNRHRE